MNNTKEGYSSKLEKKGGQYFEILFKVAEHLELDYEKARRAKGHPSDVFINSIVESEQESLKAFCDFAKDKHGLELGSTLKEFLDLQNKARGFKGVRNE
jgi:hypothetical protein